MTERLRTSTAEQTETRSAGNATAEAERNDRVRASVWDLDHTLLSTDTFAEQCIVIALHKPWLLPMLALWLFRGRGYCKGRVARICATPAGEWPVRPEAMERLDRERAAGRPIVLATAAHDLVAGPVAERLACFDAILSSSDVLNMKGVRKRDAIARLVHEAGWAGYSYAGDSASDLPVWRTADEIVVVAPSRRLEGLVKGIGKPVSILGERRSMLYLVWKACRPHQWAKNVLLFLPMLLAHKTDTSSFLAVAVAFAAFSLCASGVYVLNDLGDLAADRKHPRKRNRPFASGNLSAGAGIVLAVGLFAVSFAASWLFLPPLFSGLLLFYMVANFAYSGWWKRIPILDVMVLACMYALRLEIGGVAADVALSVWLLTFSLFFFTSLAFAKRYVEMMRLGRTGEVAAGRGYAGADVDLLESFGVASGYVSVMVLALYMNSDQMRGLYGDGRAFWLVCPLVLYWITRVWLLARRGMLNEDPVVFAVTDRTSLCIALACLALGAWSSYLAVSAQ